MSIMQITGAALLAALLVSVDRHDPEACVSHFGEPVLSEVPRPILVAHRGASHHAPENTLAALRLAIEQGAEAIEFDIWCTRDDIPVLLHDRTLKRTTNLVDWNRRHRGDAIPERIREANWEEVRQLDAGSWKSVEFQNEPLPTLAAALDLIGERAVSVIEIKDKKASAAVANVVADLKAQSRVCVISFHDQVLAAFHKLQPGCTTALLVGGEIPKNPGARHARELVARARRVQASGLSVAHRWVSPEFAATVRGLGMMLAVWTVDDGVRARELTRVGVSMITTNRVPLIQAALRKKGE